MLRWIVRENKLDSDVCEDTFWEDRIDGNAEKFVMATGEASVPDKHPHQLYSAAVCFISNSK